jgi:hypothetical protein
MSFQVSAKVVARIIGMIGNGMPLTIGPSQLTNFGPVDISARNRKNIADRC